MPRMLQPGADRSDARDDLAVRRALGDREEQVGDAIGIGLVGGHRCRRPLWCSRKGGEQQDQVQLEQVAKLGLREAMDMETFAGREVDHALAIEPVEAVAQDRKSTRRNYSP